MKSIKVPKGFNKFDKEDLDILKNNIENDPESYFNKEIIHGFSDSLNTALIISVVKDNNLLKKLNKDFKNYLNETNEEVVKNQYMINNIKAVEYQIKNNLSNSISSKYNEILLDLEKIFEKISIFDQLKFLKQRKEIEHSKDDFHR